MTAAPHLQVRATAEPVDPIPTGAISRRMTETNLARATASPGKLQLWIEWSVLFIGVPVLMLAFLGQYSLFLTVWMLAAIAALLLWMTPGFQWGDLWRPISRRGWWTLLGFSAATLAVTLSTVLLLVPERLFELPLHRTGLWVMIMLLYPPVSAWPQELIFRTLFFERYGRLFPNAAVAIAVNGAAFAFGHLFFQNWVTIAMTGLAGAVIGWAYLYDRSLWLSWALHSLGGMIVFSSGLGIFFYHGVIGATP
ncbi:MAG: CPBP family intramembrane glutamic endopeptidase [Pseudomonadota bacterium]